MRARRRARLYHACGGSILGRCGGLDTHRALDLFRHFGREADRLSRLGDVDGARFCARAAVDLADAIVDASNWRRAAGADGPNPMIGQLTRFMRDNRAPRYR